MAPINNSQFYIKLPIYISLALVCGILIGAVMTGKSGKSNVAQQYKKISEILGYVENDYVDTVNIETLVDYSITKMLVYIQEQELLRLTFPKKRQKFPNRNWKEILKELVLNSI